MMLSVSDAKSHLKILYKKQVLTKVVVISFRVTKHLFAHEQTLSNSGEERLSLTSRNHKQNQT